MQVGLRDGRIPASPPAGRMAAGEWTAELARRWIAPG